MRVVFFGTPTFAVPSLEALRSAGFDVPLVVTQPDRPVGRSGRPRPSPVGQLAADHGIPTEKPERLRDNRVFFDRLAALAPDAIAVVAYGKLLPDEVLELPPLGCVNVHASLLPKYRGASPIPAAILAGDAETGVATMRIVRELDAGPVYLERRVRIDPADDADRLSGRLAREGAGLLVETLRGLEAGTLEARPQSGEPTFTRPLSRDQGRVDWSRPAVEIARRLRAFTPWPGAYTLFNGERVKILEVEEADRGVRARAPGTLWAEGDAALAAAGDGTALVLRKVQRAGRRPVSGMEFLRGIPALPARFDEG